MNEFEAKLRRQLGIFCASMGVIFLAAVAAARLSAHFGNLAALTRLWGLFFFGHFILFILIGIILQVIASARCGLFFGGPFIDYSVAIAALVVVDSVTAAAVRGGYAAAAICLPGIFLITFGLRMKTARPLFSPKT